MPSFKFVWRFQVCVFCRQSSGEEGEEKKRKLEIGVCIDKH